MARPKYPMGLARFGCQRLRLTGLLASVVFRTAKGTLVFENLHKDAVVTADGETITVEWPEGQGKGHARVSIPVGTAAFRLQ